MKSLKWKIIFWSIISLLDIIVFGGLLFLLVYFSVITYIGIPEPDLFLTFKTSLLIWIGCHVGVFVISFLIIGIILFFDFLCKKAFNKEIF